MTQKARSACEWLNCLKLSYLQLMCQSWQTTVCVTLCFFQLENFLGVRVISAGLIRHRRYCESRFASFFAGVRLSTAWGWGLGRIGDHCFSLSVSWRYRCKLSSAKALTHWVTLGRCSSVARACPVLQEVLGATDRCSRSTVAAEGFNVSSVAPRGVLLNLTRGDTKLYGCADRAGSVGCDAGGPSLEREQLFDCTRGRFNIGFA